MYLLRRAAKRRNPCFHATELAAEGQELVDSFRTASLIDLFNVREDVPSGKVSLLEIPSIRGAERRRTRTGS